ncbi:hypothetical protein M3090_03825 [Bacteroides sp. ET71]|uniref:hypothetical protein n=1 Tax=Bacteroides sp. ET71 TaxID=2939421 RepID=UPI0020128B58|nr:hypothetical protein [Bacteroides sp. ET71]MCL1615525.1 hypothetical protein [Bacteroides sp. ET71]
MKQKRKTYFPHPSTTRKRGKRHFPPHETTNQAQIQPANTPQQPRLWRVTAMLRARHHPPQTAPQPGQDFTQPPFHVRMQFFKNPPCQIIPRKDIFLTAKHPYLQHPDNAHFSTHRRAPRMQREETLFRIKHRSLSNGYAINTLLKTSPKVFPANIVGNCGELCTFTPVYYNKVKRNKT